LNLVTRLFFTVSIALPIGVQANDIFFSGFEPAGLVPIDGATVELRASDGTVKASTQSEPWGLFPLFPAPQIVAGDSIVAYGGIWGADAFAGEFRLLLDGSPAPQNIGAITTLVSTLAGSDQVQGSTPAERLANAVALLRSFGLIDDDWRMGSPERVRYPIDDAVSAANGIQNWVATLLAQVQAGSIDDAFMSTFPFANGGVLDVAIATDAASWLPGDDGQVQLEVSHVRAAAPAWVFEAMNLPAWMTLSPQGELTFLVPEGAVPAVLSLEIRVSDPVTSAGRVVNLEFRIEDGTVVAQQTFGAAGGALWHPDGNIGLEVPPSALAEPTVLQWVDYSDAQGDTVNLFRVVPSDRVFAQSVRIAFADPNARAGNTSIENCWSNVEPDHLESGWFAKLHCELANFLLIEQKAFPGLYWSTLVAQNRVSRPLDFPPLFSIKGRNFVQPASTLTARCGGSTCAGRRPVLFIHGYTPRNAFGGGKGTWQDLPELVHDWSSDQDPTRFAAYEFRYRSNARFEEIARDLGHAIELIYQETGQRKVHIIAHSFGGLVARTYLQGLSANAPVGTPAASCSAPSGHPYVESLLTLGTPHAGIADSRQNLHDVWMPKGQQGLGGAGIGKCGEWKFAACGDLSVWQAGEWGPFNDADEQRFTTAYQVGSEPGELIAKLKNFSQNPLPVPTLAMVGLLDEVSPGLSSNTTATEGDGLISYQGQRFWPGLSCTSQACANAPIGSAPFMTTDGHCLYEQILGAPRSNSQPIPGSTLEPQTVLNAYRHSTALFWRSGTAAEPGVQKSSHLPGLAASRPLSLRHDGATHDTFNRVLSWIVERDVEPSSRYIDVDVRGLGTVLIVADGVTESCQSTSPSPDVSTKCLIVINSAQASLRASPAVGMNVAKFLPTCGSPTIGCSRRIGAYESVEATFSSNQPLLNIKVQGQGRINVNGTLWSCTDDCTFSLLPGNNATLTTAEGNFLQWSGRCGGSVPLCQFPAGPSGSIAYVTASFTAPNPPPTATGLLNDTGIQFCGAATNGNGTCTGSSPQGQDAYYGRDALAAAGQLTKIGGGNAGFDYTKISNSGQPLPASATLGSAANDWACTRDNVTGLIWEVKVNNAAQARHMDHRYTWYNTSSPDGNPGVVGSTSSCGNTLGGNACNTQSYTQAVNAARLCGASDWRMPTRKELQGIVDYGRFAPAIDGTYFVNTASSEFWSGSPGAYFPGSAWDVGFDDGFVDYVDWISTVRARLVRGGQ